MPELNAMAREIRRIILEQSRRAHVGHIASALSIADVMAALYGQAMHIPTPNDPDRDRFILSKGHAALALYAALYLRGWVEHAELQTFCGDASKLGVHPEPIVAGIDFATGSLGHGICYGAGAALAARVQKSARRTFVVVSDAECNEGSLWEAVMFAAHHQLSSLVVVIDLNGQQALGYTCDVMDLSPMTARWRAFGWDTHEIDGHDPALIAGTVAELNTVSGPPHVLVARTVAGKGVSFMERQIKWHYWPMSEDEYDQAMEGLKA